MSARWPLAGFLSVGLFWGTWAALLPDLKIQVNASDAEFGLAMLGTGVGALPAMLVTGRLWRRLGWWLLPLNGLFFAATAIGPVFASSSLALFVSMVFVGAASGALDVSINSAVSDVEVGANRRLMYGAHALFSLADLISSVATGIARDAGYGPVTVLPVAAAVMALIGIGSISSARTPLTEIAAANGSASRAARRAAQAITVLAVLCAVSFLIEDAIQNWSALHLERSLGASPVLGGAAPGIFAGAMFLGRSSGQWLGARFKDRALLVSGALLAAIGLVVVAFAASPVFALAGFALSGAGIALVAPALFARAGRLAGSSGRGAAIARLSFFGYFGFLIGPILMGFISQAVGLPAAFLSLAALAVGLAAAGALVLGDRHAGTFQEGEELLKTSRA